MPARFEVYFDFDNTVTDFDLLDEIIRRFSINDQWMRVEAAWEAGEIGSRECLAQQLAEVRVAEPKLHEYLRTIRIDPSFPSILELLRNRGIEPVIVSDSFSSIIEKTLEYNDVRGLRILANEIAFDGDRPHVSFPFTNPQCGACANCKTSHLFGRGHAPGSMKIYVGDGRSDICPAGLCEILFAKDKLYQHYEGRHAKLYRFETLSTVHTQLLQILK